MTIHICTSGTSIGGIPMQDGDITTYRASIAERIESFRAQKPSREFLAAVSAETNSLSRIGIEPSDEVILLRTDTEDGLACAEAVSEVLYQELGVNAEIRRVAGLQVTDAKTFAREGIPELFSALDRIAGEGARYQDIRLNVTGGFKSVVPYVTLYGLMNRLPVDYLFERSETPLSLPPAPVNFDYNFLRHAEPALRALREEGVLSHERFWELLEGLAHDDRTLLMECLTETEGDKVTTSAFADLLLQSDAVQGAEIYLSRNAQNAFEKADGRERPMLSDLMKRGREPLWRKAHYHSFHGTDREVFKQGDVGRRMAALSRPGKLYVCELYTAHDDYETDLNGRYRADYDLSQFVPWTEPPLQEGIEAPLGQEEQHRRQQAQIDTLTHERDQLKEQVEARERKITDARKERDEAVAAARRDNEQALAEAAQQLEADVARERARGRAELEAAQDDLAEKDAAIARLVSERDQARMREQARRVEAPPWYRRLGAIFVPSLWHAPITQDAVSSAASDAPAPGNGAAAKAISEGAAHQAGGRNHPPAPARERFEQGSETENIMHSLTEREKQWLLHWASRPTFRAHSR